ncbi:hypothetical protein [Niallia sp. FSL W8-0635]
MDNQNEVHFTTFDGVKDVYLNSLQPIIPRSMLNNKEKKKQKKTPRSLP